MLIEWILFNLSMLILLICDLFVFHRKSEKITMKNAVAWSLFWITLAMLFNYYIYATRGKEDAIKFFTGYVIEKSLSVDNLFIFLMILHSFKTPLQYIHKVLFWGVLGAIVMRALFIGYGVVLIKSFYWLVYVFGIFLVFTGIKMGIGKKRKKDLQKNPAIKLARMLFPITEDYEGDKFFVKKEGQRYATPLLLVLLAVETFDIIFALDSIPAIFAITLDPFLIFTSNIFAILGLRSLYFVLSHMASLFRFLHYGIALILVFIGLKMLLHDIVKIPVLVTLGLIFVVLSISILCSYIRKKK